MLISYLKSLQLLGLLQRRLKGDIRFDQLEGLQEEEPDGKKGNKESPLICRAKYCSSYKKKNLPLLPTWASPKREL